MTNEQPLIDRHQGRVFIVVILIIVAAFAVVAYFWGKRPVNYDEIQSIALTVGIAACGTASSIIVFWLISVHENQWWGNAKDAIAFVATGGLLSMIASVIELIKAFVKVLG